MSVHSCVWVYFGVQQCADGMKGENDFMNIGYILVLILDVVTGVASTLYLLVSLFAVLGQKIYGKVKYGKSLYD